MQCMRNDDGVLIVTHKGNSLAKLSQEVSEHQAHGVSIVPRFTEKDMVRESISKMKVVKLQGHQVCVNISKVTKKSRHDPLFESTDVGLKTHTKLNVGHEKNDCRKESKYQILSTGIYIRSKKKKKKKKERKKEKNIPQKMHGQESIS